MTAPLDAIARLIGPAHLAVGEAAHAANADVFWWPQAAAPLAVARPGSTEEVAGVLRLLAASRTPVVPRGSGLSYTGGLAADRPSVMLDLARLDAISLAAEDMHATIGAGCTWEALAAGLRPHGLRSVLAGPISGSHSTVGGAAAQNLPGSMEGVIGLTVVLADGTVVRTGSGGMAGRSRFYRGAGPDLTGLFLGDCGAFGIKTEIVLRLQPIRPVACASFALAGGAATAGAIVTLQRAGFPGRAFAMDQARAEDAGKVGVAEALRTAASVAQAAGSFGQALGSLAGLARARSDLAATPWSLHLTAEGVTDVAANEAVALARRVLREVPEIPPAVPQALQARPFSIRGLVGPEGERWVPVHGILPLSAAVACLDALGAALAARAEAFAAARIRVGWIMSATGPHVTIEPMFYWPDALDPLHLATLSERNRARFAGRPRNEEARRAVEEARATLAAIFAAHGAVHAQLGRFYPAPEGPLPARIKAALDPSGLMNPGVLGLG